MTELTAEKRAELRRLAEIGSVVGPKTVLSLLDALDAAEAKLVTMRDAPNCAFVIGQLQLQLNELQAKYDTLSAARANTATAPQSEPPAR